MFLLHGRIFTGGKVFVAGGHIGTNRVNLYIIVI